jgi:hydroxyacyl-ACP dehydratase HTD2-like protein with hotdog domain
MFRFSAATWNAHRLHYDTGFAKTVGYSDVVVQLHLHQAYLIRACTDLPDMHFELDELSIRVHQPAFPGSPLTVRGEVVGSSFVEGAPRWRVELRETGTKGEVYATGVAMIGPRSR